MKDRYRFYAYPPIDTKRKVNITVLINISDIRVFIQLLHYSSNIFADIPISDQYPCSLSFFYKIE